MVNGQLMYLRPGNLFKDFIIEHSKSDLKSGRPSVSYEGDGTDFLRGCLASANEVDKAHGTADHIITHVSAASPAPNAPTGSSSATGCSTSSILTIPARSEFRLCITLRKGLM